MLGLLSSLILGLSLSHIPAALAGQIPVVDGVIGGISTTTSNIAAPKEDVIAAVTAGKLRVTENSGVCETTPGVYQASGYGDIASNKSLFFWYFNARNNPETAPLALWFNGGPGSSSMIGLLQELGPCRINNDSSSVSLNPYSWNTNANVLFIDQPVGVGFSYGTLDVGTSQEAAADVWTFLQIFLKDRRFSHLQGKDLAIWTESYGGHYGPTFAAYFLSQNEAIAKGTVSGLHLNLKVLGVGDGLTDPLNQYPGYLTYAASNPYHPLVNTSTINAAKKAWTKCRSMITSCYHGGSDTICSNAQSYCNNYILGPLAGNYDVYYVLAVNPDPYPPDITDYLNSIGATVGANSTWEESNGEVYDNFARTGDWMRNSAPDLETVINAGVRTIVYDGDADYILNFNGVEWMVGNLTTKFSDLFSRQNFASYTVNGQAAGLFKNAGTFSYVRIFGAGHEVPAYKYGTLATGQAALQMFEQIMSNRSLTPT